MQPKLTFNLHGAVGLVFIALMFGIAFFLNWNINWWYFIPSVGLYSLAVIALTQALEAEEGQDSTYIVRGLLGCHLALLFLAIGLLLHILAPDYLLYFMASVIGGLAIPFLLLDLHGMIALLLIISLFGVAFFYNWSFDWLYWLYFVVAIGLYAGACLVLHPDNYTSSEKSSSRMRPQLGWHLAFVFLIVGFGIHFKDGISIIGFFVASIAIGLVIPYLLLRSSR